MDELSIARIVCGAYEENAYLLCREGRQDAVLIDPGDDYAALSGAVKSSGRQLTDILLTHGHFDHFLCAAHLAKDTGARIHIHPYDAYMLSSQTDSVYSAPMCREPFTPVDADCPYEAAEESLLCVGGTRFKVLHTPGHTHGGVCLLSEDDGVLFSGDTMFAAGYGRTDFPGGSVHELVGSLRMLLAMDPALTVYPGHGESAALAQIARYFHR